MVSTVEGRLRDGVGLAELLAATFPGGSITGAPKIAAVDLIAEIEPVGRGASMGALGRVFGNGDLDLALTIRTFAIAEGQIHLWVGGGVVWDSDPAGGDRGVVGQGRSAAARDRRATGRARRAADAGAATCGRGPMSAGDLLAVAVSGRGLVDPGEPVLARRRRGVHARPRGVRDDAGLRRPAVPARRSISPASRARRSASDSSVPTRGEIEALARSRSSGRRRPRRYSASTGRRGRRAASTAQSSSSGRSRAGSRWPGHGVSDSCRCCTRAARRHGSSRRRSRRATPSQSRPKPRRRRAARTTRCSSTRTTSCSRGR